MLTTEMITEQMIYASANTNVILRKLAEGKELTPREIDRITYTDVDIRVERSIDDVRAYSKTPYNDSFVNDVHHIKGAKWDPDDLEWSVPVSEIDKLKEIIANNYGTTKAFAPVSIITIQLKDDYNSEEHNDELELNFHGQLICSGLDGYISTGAYPLHNLYSMGKTGGSHRNPTLTMNAGAEFAIVMNKEVAENLRLFEDDDLFEVVDYKTVEPIHEMIVEYEKIKETQHLIKQRETLLNDLATVNEQLSKRGFPEAKDKNGTFADIDIDKEEKRKKEIRREERRKIRELRRQAKTDPEKLKQLTEIQDAKAKAKAKAKSEEAKRKAEEEKKEHLYVSPADILGATQKAIIVKFNTSSFWFPKGYVKKVTENDKCWLDLKQPFWMCINDAEDRNKAISGTELRAVYGDVNKAKTTGDEDDLDLALEGKYQPNLEVKEAEADESLKR